ncbi:MAG: hypothetical protein QNJ11_04790 [Woeseiaceae bacterium]|nr:hypothetical protein [Woeseiaceae bacterium]
MTEDANNSELARAYRDLATESTPPELDDHVLRMAARETRSRYGIARAWVRPVAWAATIGLSLAIMLEVAQIIPPGSEPELSPSSEAVSERFRADEGSARLEQSAAPSEDKAEAPAAVAPATEDFPANPGGGAAEELRAGRPVGQDEIESRSAELDDGDAFAAKNMRILEEAEMQAIQRAGEQSIATLAAVPNESEANQCDEEVRESAETWYECIVDLRDAGDAELAAFELDALLKTYPDFEVPSPGK